MDVGVLVGVSVDVQVLVGMIPAGNGLVIVVAGMVAKTLVFELVGV